MAAPQTPSSSSGAPLPLTPASSSRRSNVPATVKDWIFGKAKAFEYYAEGLRTKEEKQEFIAKLTQKLNSRFIKETGEWDETRTGTFVRNLKKTAVTSSSSSRGDACSSSSTPTSAPRAPFTLLISNWQQHLIAASRLNSETLARHSTNRGTCNEELVKSLLSSLIGSSRLIGIGTGEVLSSAAPRQIDVLLYNTAYPCLSPAGLLSRSGPACFLRESVMAIVEVKTTLTNQDLRDVGSAASEMAPHPFIVIAFDSQVSLRAINVTLLPANVVGVCVLSHGCLVRHSGAWVSVHPSQQIPLQVFLVLVLDALSQYAGGHAVIGGEDLSRLMDTLMSYCCTQQQQAGSEEKENTELNIDSISLT